MSDFNYCATSSLPGHAYDCGAGQTVNSHEIEQAALQCLAAGSYPPNACPYPEGSDAATHFIAFALVASIHYSANAAPASTAPVAVAPQAEADFDFVPATDVKLCLLNDPGCEACQ